MTKTMHPALFIAGMIALTQLIWTAIFMVVVIDDNNCKSDFIHETHNDGLKLTVFEVNCISTIDISLPGVASVTTNMLAHRVFLSAFARPRPVLNREYKFRSILSGYI